MAELTRAALEAARDHLKWLVEDGITESEHEHILLAAAEKLLAMRPASIEEVIALVDDTYPPAGRPSEQYLGRKLGLFDGYRACERRLLPFADDAPDTPAPTETTR